MVTTAEQNVSLQQPNVVTSSKVKANSQVLKVVPGGKNKGIIGKGKGTKPLNKGKGSAVKPTTSRANTSEQGTTFPMRMGPTVGIALINMGATGCCMSETYYKKLQLPKSKCYMLVSGQPLEVT